jgi:hypothetical protein
LREGVTPMPHGTPYAPPFMPPFGMQFQNQMPPPPPTMPSLPPMPQQPPPQGQGQPGPYGNDPWQGGINPSMTALLPPEGAPQPAQLMGNFGPPASALGWPGLSKSIWGAPAEPTGFAYPPAETAQPSPPSGVTAIVGQPQTSQPAESGAGLPPEIEVRPSTVETSSTHEPSLTGSPMRWPPITAGIPIHPEAIQGVPSASRLEDELVATAAEAPPSLPFGFPQFAQQVVPPAGGGLSGVQPFAKLAGIGPAYSSAPGGPPYALSLDRPADQPQATAPASAPASRDPQAAAPTAPVLPVPTISVRPIGRGFSIDGSYSTRNAWNASKKL